MKTQDEDKFYLALIMDNYYQVIDREDKRPFAELGTAVEWLDLMTMAYSISDECGTIIKVVWEMPSGKIVYKGVQNAKDNT